MMDAGVQKLTACQLGPPHKWKLKINQKELKKNTD